MPDQDGGYAGPMTLAARKWASDLAAWAIPPEILAQAPESPWIHPPVLFQAPDAPSDSPSRRHAL
jgi:hypothetical protein